MLRLLLALLFLSFPLHATPSPLASLGKKIFTDTSLSNPPGQSCISCHQPQAAFSDPRRVSPGAVKGPPPRMGTRNAPTLMYAAIIPPRNFEEAYDEKGIRSFFIEGGLFLDGRAHDTFAQVREPFFNKDEMNLKDEAALAAKLRKSTYQEDLKKLTTPEKFTDDKALTTTAYSALVEFLREPLFRPFDARIDDFFAGKKDALTPQELRGYTIFAGKAKCASCHLVGTQIWPQATLSDYGYDNLGVPSNHPQGKKDPGLFTLTKNPEHLGQFRAPTLRNIALTAPYMHNGSIKTLKEVMEFYNKRDLEPDRWGPTDYPQTVNKADFGDLKLTDQEIEDLTALMQAFTDRSLLNMKKGQQFPTPPKNTPSTENYRTYFPLLKDRLPMITRPKGLLEGEKFE